jgi:hypothetical protein
MTPDPLAEEAPLIYTIGRDPTVMSDTELTAHLNDLRALKGSAPTRRSRVTKTKEPKSKVDFNALFQKRPENPPV